MDFLEYSEYPFVLEVEFEYSRYFNTAVSKNLHVSVKFPIYTVNSVLENTDVTPLAAGDY